MIDAVIRNLEVIGEAAKSLPISIKEQHSEVPWEKIAGMRNRIVHEYFGVDETILWQTIQDDLVPLRIHIAAILAEFED